MGAKLKIGELSKSGLKRADELCLELIVYLFAGIILLDIAADIGIEEHGVVYLIGIYARAADCDIDIKAYLRIETRNGIGFGVPNLLSINSLVLK